jgi:copper chaperone CopZ
MMVKPPKGRASAILRIRDRLDDSRPDYGNIQASLSSLPGISNVSLNEVTDMVKVEYDPDLLTLEAIRGTIDSSKNSEKA